MWRRTPGRVPGGPQSSGEAHRQGEDPVVKIDEENAAGNPPRLTRGTVAFQR